MKLITHELKFSSLLEFLDDPFDGKQRSNLGDLLDQASFDVLFACDDDERDFHEYLDNLDRSFEFGWK